MVKKTRKKVVLPYKIPIAIPELLLLVNANEHPQIAVLRYTNPALRAQKKDRRQRFRSISCHLSFSFFQSAYCKPDAGRSAPGLTCRPVLNQDSYCLADLPISRPLSKAALFIGRSFGFLPSLFSIVPQTTSGATTSV